MRARGRWCYLYRTIDSDSNLVDSMLSQKQDMETAKSFFQQALDIAADVPPEQVVTDGLKSYPREISEVLGKSVQHQRRGCQGNSV
ncbi:MAG: DDE-type integrase/transposase/recombinase [Synechococcus sp.]